MNLIYSSKDNIESAWVKNEWSRYLLLRRNDASKTLIPLYFDMNPEELPEEFGLLSAQNINEDGFEQELIRGIKKLIPTPIELKARRKKRNKIMVIAAAVLLAIIIPVISINYFKQAKEKRIAAELLEKYTEAEELFKSKEYEKAKVLFDELGQYEDSEQMSLKSSYYADYDIAMQLFYEEKYPEAVWALNKIGDYDEVKASLERAKKAWREDLSTIAVDVDLGTNARGSYYISTNGTVDTFKENPGNENVIVKDYKWGEVVGNETVPISDHGKVMSIAQNKALYYLCEDGYVYNSGKLNQTEEDWSNAIQISDVFNVTNAVLLEDGTIKLGQIKVDSEYEKQDDEWLVEATKWTNIVQIDWAIERVDWGEVGQGIFVGLDSSGKVKILFKSFDEYYSDITLEDGAKKFVEGLNNIKKIRVNTGIDYTDIDNPVFRINIVALDNDNNLHVFSSGKEYVKDAEDLKDFWVSLEGRIYVIDSKNRLLELNSDKVILEGAVYVDNGYCVSQSGTIYTLDGTATSGKTKVKDTWLSR